MHVNIRSSATVSSSERPDRSASLSSAEKQSDTPTCSCGATELKRISDGETICPECHAVQTTKPLSLSPRPHYGDQERKRAGSRTTFQWADRGLGVGLTVSGTDGNGERLSQRRLTRESGWTKHRTSEECRLDYALGEIRRMGAEFDLPQPELEEAARLYRKARTARSVTGRSVEGFVTACLLAAIRRSPQQIPVSERELRTVTRADRDQIRTARGALTVELDVEIPPIDASAFLPRAASELSTPKAVERDAQILLNVYSNGDGAHRGTSPRTLAAAAMHAAYDRQGCAERPTLQALSDVFDVARSTISSQKNELIRAVEGDV